MHFGFARRQLNATGLSCRPTKKQEENMSHKYGALKVHVERIAKSIRIQNATFLYQIQGDY